MWVRVSVKRGILAPISRPRVCAGCTMGDTRSHLGKSGVRGAVMVKKAKKALREKGKQRGKQKKKVKSEFEKIVYIARVGKGIFRRMREGVTFRKKANQRRLFSVFRGRPRKKKVVENFLLLFIISWGHPKVRKD